jgi:hypothetical protein
MLRCLALAYSKRLAGTSFPRQAPNDAGNLAYLAQAMANDGFAQHECQACSACDNFKSFNQFALHQSEWSCFYLTFTPGCYIHVASERVPGLDVHRQGASHSASPTSCARSSRSA